MKAGECLKNENRIKSGLSLQLPFQTQLPREKLSGRHALTIGNISEECLSKAYMRQVTKKKKKKRCVVNSTFKTVDESFYQSKFCSSVLLVKTH